MTYPKTLVGLDIGESKVPWLSSISSGLSCSGEYVEEVEERPGGPEL